MKEVIEKTEKTTKLPMKVKLKLKSKEKMTQKEKVDRGAKGEALITSSLKAMGVWNRKLINYGHGTPFDKLIVFPNRTYAVEVKTRLRPFISYSTISENERNGLDDFMKKVGDNRAGIIGIWLDGENKRAFWIPWKDVREAVLFETRGSIDMRLFDEFDRVGSGWDLGVLASCGR